MRAGVARLALGPVLLWQGARVRRSILRLPEPPGPRAGRAGAGPALRLLILGDSAAAGVGVDHQDRALSGRLLSRLTSRHDVTWQVLARTGWTTADALAALGTLGETPFDMVVCSLGVNDLTTEVAAEGWIATYARLVKRLIERHGVTRVIASGLPPMGRFPALPQPLRWYMGLRRDAHERALADWSGRTSGVVHVALDLDLDLDAMARDGFHPGAKVYDAWAARVDSALITDPAGAMPASR